MDNEDINNYKLKLKTEQAGAFSILVEAIKEILTEGDVKEIVPDEQSEKKYYNHENAFYPLQQTM